MSKINPQQHSLNASPTASVFDLYEMACVSKARTNPRPNRPCNIKEVDRFKK